MATSIEDLSARVEKLEQLFGKDVKESAALQRAHPFWQHIPFEAWLKISGPTFAVMALGLGALWTAQQATTQQILDLQQSTTDRILAVQDRILEMERTTTDRILEMQQQTFDLIRESRDDGTR